MIKTAILSGILLGAAHGAFVSAQAGPYANIESNSAIYGDDFQGSVLEVHAGYEGELGESTGYYVQAGPAFTFADGEEASTDFSGKVGVVTELTDKVEVYGEYSFITGDELSSGVKAGATYRF